MNPTPERARVSTRQRAPAGARAPDGPAHGRARARRRSTARLGLVLSLLAAVGTLVTLMVQGGAAAEPAAGPPPDKPIPIEAHVPLQPPTSPGEALVTLDWGTGPGEVGISRPEEGLSRGPEALAVAPNGRMAVLDSVNERLLLLASDGSFLRSVPLSLASPRFLSAGEDRIAVLDADADSRLQVLDWEGKVLQDRTVASSASEASVTRIFLVDDEVLIERGHDQVLSLDDDGNEAEHLPGRPLDPKGGLLAQAGFAEDAPQISVYDPLPPSGEGSPARAGTTPRAEVRMRAEQQIEYLVSLDGDGRDGFILGAVGPEDPRILLARVPARGLELESGARRGRGPLPAGAVYLDAEEYVYVGDPYVVAPSGLVYQPQATAESYTIRVHRVPEGGAPR